MALLALIPDEDSLLGSILRFFIQPVALDIEGAYDTALSWLITAIVIAVLLTIGMQVFKWLLKARAAMVDRYWPLRKTITFMAAGLFPVFAALSAIYYFTLDYTSIVGVSGLFKGVVFAWLLYISLMVSSDLIFPWSRYDYKFKRRA